MIVLAIAAVILLIVLLSVPALQRNSRNTQRNNDAATLAAAINTCMANHNSVVSQCGGTGAIAGSATAGPNAPVDMDWTKTGQLTSATGNGGGGCTASTTNACWYFGFDCPAGGVIAAGSPHTAATSRQFTVEFQIETTSSTITRCISS